MNIRSLENPSETKTIDVLSSPLRTVTNSELGAVIFDDITERMRSENELSAVYRREHQIAETLQQSILLVENNLQATGFDFHACYRPAVSEAAIGGDFFDAFPINKNLVAFTIGDVSGKGLVAAARTAETKYTLRAFLREYPSPSLALVRLNEYLCERQRSPETEIEGFICLTIIVANSKTGQVSISSAGFEPPIIVQEDFETYSMPVEGSLPVGIMPGQQYQKKTIQLAENDVLILATDGVTEAKGKSDLFGTERFIKSSDQARSMDSLEQATKLILNDAAAFAGGNLHDDACIIAMRRMPLAKPPRSRHRADREAA
jgi:sigma-B regulation protein RsbU (phosphoserine phosphatase)